MSLGPYAPFIVTSYALVAAVVLLLIIFVCVTTFYFHDFWNQPAPDNLRTLIDALKNLSLIGALFIIAGYGRGPRRDDPAYGDV